MRMRQHCDNALAIAQFLEKHPAVAYVRYPGLDSHPQHDLAKHQLDGGFGGMLAFGLRGDAATHNRFVSSLTIIRSAVSLGHDESLIVYVAKNNERAHLYPEPFQTWGHLRFSAGIEDPRDLIDDLSQALAKSVPG
jgi:methionine-gamma-lyase